MARRHLLAASSVLAAALVAGCGSSNSDTAQIQSPPSQSQSLSFTPTATSTSTATTPSSTTGPTLVTPKTGKLSVEPKITVPKTAAPKTLVTNDLVKGTGAVARAGDTITVNYVGVVYKTGKVFDSSWGRGQTFSTPLGEGAVISGWDRGLVGMQVGGRRELTIPPSLAYGASGQGSIPGNATLIFIVDLLGVSRPTGATGVTGATYAPGSLPSSGSSGSTGTTATGTTSTTGASSTTGSTGATASTGATG